MAKKKKVPIVIPKTKPKRLKNVPAKKNPGGKPIVKP